MDFLKSLINQTSSNKSQLGLFWGKDAFYLAETAKGLPDKLIEVPFNTPIQGDQGQNIPESLRLTALLQQVIREKKIISKKINISVSSKDVIYRSFIIPFMQPNEVKNVVDFEATKYIPIKLDELSYCYHAVPLNEGNQKSLRILFVAARKNTLEKYIGILHNAGIETDHIEPSSVSLIRILQKQGHVPRQQSSAIIEIEKEGGRITVIEKDIVQFVREFQSSIEGIGVPSENTKFFNDIRVSFNFYQRQNTQAKLDRMLIIANNDYSALAEGLKQEFKVPSSAITLQKILKNDFGDLGILSASGASSREKAISSKNFDLSIKSARAGKNIGEPTGTFAQWNFKTLSIGLGIAFVLLAGTIIMTKNSLKNARQTSLELKQKLGIYETSDPSSITELTNGVQSKISQYKSIRIDSDVAYFLKMIPEFLPKGTWLNNFSIEYYETTVNAETGQQKVSKVAVGLDGYVYLPNQNDQLRQVNILVETLKNNEKLKDFFSEITLSNVKQDISNNYPVTNFRISCK